MPPVTRVKSLGSTPWAVNRGPQLAMADLTCASGTGLPSRRSGDTLARHDLGWVVAEVGQQHGGGVTARGTGDGPAGVGAAAGLVQPGDGHPVARPAGRGAQRAAERRPAIPAV